MKKIFHSVAAVCCSIALIGLAGPETQVAFASEHYAYGMGCTFFTVIGLAGLGVSARDLAVNMSKKESDSPSTPSPK